MSEEPSEEMKAHAQVNNYPNQEEEIEILRLERFLESKRISSLLDIHRSSDALLAEQGKGCEMDLFRCSVVLSKLGRLDEAIEVICKGLAIEPRNPEARRTLLQILNTNKELEGKSL